MERALLRWHGFSDSSFTSFQFSYETPKKQSRASFADLDTVLLEREIGSRSDLEVSFSLSTVRVEFEGCVRDEEEVEK